MEKVAVLILCHKNLEQVYMFINSFNKNAFDFFVHVDKKFGHFSKIKSDNVYFVDDNDRVDVGWGGMSQIDATLELLKYAKNNSTYIYYWLVSGQDFLIKDSMSIYNMLKDSKKNYVTLFETTGKFLKRVEIKYPKWISKNSIAIKIIKNCYMILTGGRKHTLGIFKTNFSKKQHFAFGYQWFCFNNSFVEYILAFVDKNKWYYDGFSKTIVPDESFFCTLLENSEFKNTQSDGLVYVDWSQNKRSPKILTISDYETLENSKYFIARKFDSKVDGDIINKLMVNLNE